MFVCRKKERVYVEIERKRDGESVCSEIERVCSCVVR